MLPPTGVYRYEIWRAATLIAIEEVHITPGLIIASRRESDGRTQLETEAQLDPEDKISRVSLRYASTLFRRDASYRVDGENFRGNVSALAGRTEIVIKLGRFGEIEAGGLTAYRALILAHVEQREQRRWTGRVAVIDGHTLTAAALKQTCRIAGSGTVWIYEARMGDIEEIELDAAGKIVRRRDPRGEESRLVAFS